MNREVKFRGRNYDGIWMYGYLMPAPRPTVHPCCKHIISKVLTTVDRCLYEVNEDTIGQYTGIKDKDGVEIYEGDIIMSNHSGGPIFHLISYNEKKAAFYACLDGMREDALGVCNLDKRWIDEFGKVVVGNIHDNPELIRKKQENLNIKNYGNEEFESEGHD